MMMIIVPPVYLSVVILVSSLTTLEPGWWRTTSSTSRIRWMSRRPRPRSRTTGGKMPSTSRSGRRWRLETTRSQNTHTYSIMMSALVCFLKKGKRKKKGLKCKSLGSDPCSFRAHSIAQSIDTYIYTLLISYSLSLSLLSDRSALLGDAQPSSARRHQGHSGGGCRSQRRRKYQALGRFRL